MQTNDDCTVFCRHVDAETRVEHWSPAVLHGVCWQSGGAVSDRKLPRVGNIDVFIPFSVGCDQTYLPPQAYAASPQGHWTLREGDLLMKGTFSETYTSCADLVHKDGVVQIISAAENDFGSRAMRHWEVCAR